VRLYNVCRCPQGNPFGIPYNPSTGQLAPFALADAIGGYTSNFVTTFANRTDGLLDFVRLSIDLQRANATNTTATVPWGAYGPLQPVQQVVNFLADIVSLLLPDAPVRPSPVPSPSPALSAASESNATVYIGFQTNYGSLAANSSRLASFKVDVVASIASYLAIDTNQVKAVNVYNDNGNVIVSVALSCQTTCSSGQLQGYIDKLSSGTGTASKDIVFTTRFQDRYQLQGTWVLSLSNVIPGFSQSGYYGNK